MMLKHPRQINRCVLGTFVILSSGCGGDTPDPVAPPGAEVQGRANGPKNGPLFTGRELTDQRGAPRPDPSAVRKNEGGAVPGGTRQAPLPPNSKEDAGVQERARFLGQAFERLKPGMTRRQVEAILGKPDNERGDGRMYLVETIPRIYQEIYRAYVKPKSGEQFDEGVRAMGVVYQETADGDDRFVRVGLALFNQGD